MNHGRSKARAVYDRTNVNHDLVQEIRVSVGRDSARWCSKEVGMSRFGRRVPGFALAVVLTLVALGPRWAWAQISTASLAGQVTDATGAVLVGATVTARNTETGIGRSASSDSGGRYFLTGLSPGEYSITTDLSGFTRLTVASRLTVGQAAEINLVLGLPGVEEKLVVEATPFISTTQSVVSTTILEEQVDRLPINGRTFQQLALLSPQARSGNVSPTGNFDVTKSRVGAISVSGGDGRSVNFSIDGGDANDDFVGGQTIQISQEAIQEFVVLSHSYPAEHGRATNGIINAITKSGTNDWHGDAFFFFRDRSLNSRTAIEEQLNTRKAEFQRKQYGATVGGPIKRDRVHFFASFERQNEDENSFFNSNGVFPSLEGPIPTPFTQNLYMAKLSAAPNDRMTLFVRYARENNRRDNDLAGGTRAPETATVQTNDSDAMLLSHTWTIRPNVLNEFRLQYSRFENGIRSKLGVETFPTLVFPDGEFGHNQDADQFTIEKKLHIRDDINWHIGRHDFKFGFETVLEPTLGIRGSFGRNVFSYANNDYDPATRTVGPTNSIVEFQSFSTPNVDITNKPPLKYFAFFAQDDLHVNRKLTLNLGVRYDFLLHLFPSRDTPDTRILYPALGKPRDDFGNIAPRIGAAYDVGANGRTVLRGAFGLFYNYQAASATTLFEALNVLPDPYALVLVFPNNDGSFPFGPGNIPSSFPDAFTIGQSIPPHQKVPSSYTATAGFSHSFAQAGGLALDVDYVYARGRNVPRQRDINGRKPDGTRELQGILPDQSFVSFVNEGESRYHALSAAVRKRFQGRYQLQASYTLSKATENTQGNVDSPLNQYNPEADPGETGPAFFDERHRIVVSGIVELPAKFRFSGIFQGASARPWTRRGPGDVNGDGVVGQERLLGIRGDRVGPRGGERGDATYELDLRLTKIIPIERFNPGARLELIVDVFNVLNTANFGNNYQERIDSAGFGQPINLATGPRQAQLAARFSF